MRAIFFGTPAIAVPSLLALHEVATIVGVVCQPDRPAGRGQKNQAPAVKDAALALGLDVFQPLKVRSGELAAWVREKNADVSVVIAYGRILDEAVLFAPRAGSVNLHASLLPRHRGAAPIQRALMSGDAETGVCLMQMDAGMDTGAVLATRRIPIEPDDDAGSLAEKLAALAAAMTREEVPRHVRGELVAVPQDHANATHAPPIEKDETFLDFSGTGAHELVNRVRGLAPRPGARVFVETSDADTPPKSLRVLRASVGAPRNPPLAPFEVRVEGSSILFGTKGAEPFSVDEAQLEGKKAQSARDLINGRVVTSGTRLARRPPETKGAPP